MNKIAKEKIKHVVVLMLENRSFDHLLGDFNRVNKECDGVDSKNFNKVNDNIYYQKPSSNYNLYLKSEYDPNHEFPSVKKQLHDNSDPTMSGFASEVANRLKEEKYKSLSEGLKEEIIQSIMNYFPFGEDASHDTLPALHSLARNYAVCDRWFSSIPGPTWPNRFFALTGSCHGHIRMPEGATDIVLAIKTIISLMCKDSIFSVLGNEVSHQIYSDFSVPLAIFMKDANWHKSISDFENDARVGKLPQFAWIEPTYSGSPNKVNSQHPPESVLNADYFLGNIYNSLRNSPCWQNSLFIVLYDEHGGFYDHVKPGETTPPDDEPSDEDHYSFNFSRLGVRVPAILISPHIKAGIVKNDDGTKDSYDHASLLAFLCDLFGKSDQKSRLGKRVVSTEHFGDSDIWSVGLNNDLKNILLDKKLLKSNLGAVSKDQGDLLERIFNILLKCANVKRELQSSAFDLNDIAAHQMPSSTTFSDSVSAQSISEKFNPSFIELVQNIQIHRKVSKAWKPGNKSISEENFNIIKSAIN